MQKHEAAAYIAGLSSGENSSESQTTNVHIITATVEQDSDEGTALVSVEGMVFGESDDQYFEVDTIGGLLEGDTTSLILTGEPGHGMTPLSLGGVGTVDRVVKRVSEIEADYVQAGYLEANYAHIHDGIIDNAQINDANIVDGSITGAKIRDGEITGSKIAGATITGSNIANDTITSTQISDSGITGSKIDASTFANGQISGSKIDSSTLTNIPFASIANADVEVANIADAQISNATITEAQVENLTTNYAHLQNGVIDNATINHANVNGLNTTYATISNLNAATGRIGALEADHVSVDDFEAEQASIDSLQAATADIGTIRADSAKVHDLTAAQLSAATGYIAALNADNITAASLSADVGKIHNLTANELSAAAAYIAALNADSVTAQNIIAMNGDFATVKANAAKVANLTAAQLEADHATVGALDTTYAQINMANVNNAWINNGVIKDGAISSAMINDVSANKLTAGTINGTIINVTNLNADNITTGTINGQRIGEGSLSLSKLEDDVYTEAEVDAKLSTMQSQIDGAIETWTGTAVPTLQNSPASSWNTTALKDSHVGDVYFVVNSQSQQNGYNYRFTKSGSTYSWQLIKDSDVTNALQRLNTAEGKISTFDTDISQLKTDTGTLTTKTTSLETRMSDAEADILDKVDTTTFNEVSDTVDSHSQSITQMTTTLSNKADSSTVSAVTQRVSKNEQDISGINTTIGTLQTTVESKADGSTVSSISNKLNTVSDTVDGHTQSISSINNTLETKADSSTVSTLTTKVNNVSDTVEGHTSQLSSITQTQTTIQKNAVKSTVQLWFTKADTTAPAKPTAHVTTNNAATGNAWNLAVPTYNASYPNYYYCYEYQYVNGSYGWSAVTRDIATGEMQATARQAKADIDGLEIGGRNLLFETGTIFNQTSYEAYNIPSSTSARELGAGTTLTIQFWDVVLDANSSGIGGYWGGGSSGQLFIIKPDANGYCSVTFTLSETTASHSQGANKCMYLYNLYNNHSGMSLSIGRWKLEKGNRATDWTPAPEDVDADISTAQTSADNAQATANKNVKESQQLWFTKANGSAPNKPTAKITSTSTSGNAWTTKVPTYSSSYPYYFYCMQYIAADGTVTWSDVVYDQATTEAQSVARTTSANLSTLQSDYATFKQTTQNFESTIGTTYATKTELQTTDDKIENLEIGGRNLLCNTEWTSDSITKFGNDSNALGNAIGLWRKESKAVVAMDESGLMTLTSSSSTRYGIYQDVVLEPGRYVFSGQIGSRGTVCIGPVQWPAPQSRTANGRFVQIIDVSSSATYRVYIAEANGNVSYVNWLKLERGNMPTDWTPAPEDVDAAIDKVDNKTSVRLHLRRDNWTDSLWGAYCSIGHTENFNNLHYASGGATSATGFDGTTLNVGDLIVIEGISTGTSIPYSATAKVTSVPTSATGNIPATVVSANNAKAIESRISSAETSITQTNNQIALKANASDVYTKTQTDGLISTEASNRNSAIEQSANAINLSVSQTYTTKTEFNALEVGGRNLLLRTGSDFFSGTNPAIGGGHVGSATSVVVTDDAYPGFEVLKTTRGNVTSMSGCYMYAITNRTTDGALIAGETYTLSFLAKTETEDLRFIASNIIEHIDRISESSMILNSEWTRHWFTFKIKEDGSYISPANCFYTVGTANGVYYVTKLKLEKGNKATDWTPAPEDMVSQTEFESAKSEIKTTTDGITSTVSKISSIKYYTGNSSTLANIKVWAAEGYTSTWVFTGDLSNLRVGDTVYLKYGDTTRGCNVYIKGTVNSISGQSVNFTAHGYEDVLPVDTIKSTINQSADSVKIEARHVNIEGAAIFSSGRLSETSLNNAYDTKGAAASLVAGGDNLIGGFNNSYVGNGEYNYRTGRFQSKTTLNTADNAVILQYYSGTTPTSAGTYVGQHSDAFRVANVGETCSFKFEKPSGFTHLHLKFNGNQQDARVAWDVTPIPVGTELILTFKLDSISSDGKGNGGVMSGINLRTGNMPSQWSLAPDDVEIGGRNLFVDTDRYCEVVSESSTFGGENLPDTIIPEGRVITISIEIDADNVVWSTASGQHRIGVEFSIAKTGGGYQYIGVWAGNAISEGANVVEAFTGSLHKRIFKTFTLLGDITVGRDALLYTQGVSSGSIRIGRVKVEYGTKATDWTPAPEDTDAAISAVSTVANNAAPKASAVTRTQRIYYRKSASGAPGTPGSTSSAWVSQTGNVSNAWTTMHVPISSTEKFIYTCEQRQFGDGNIAYTSVLLDNTITVIDGGNIITGSIAANKLDVYDATIGKISTSAINLSGYAQTKDIPTKVSNLTNDSGFQDSSQVETAITSKGYATQNSLNSEINQRKANYGTCSTAAATQAKAVTCSNFELVAGNELTVKFSTANTYASGAVQLNVNSKGAKNVWVANAVTSSSNQLLWGANAYITFRYDGTQFIAIGEPRTWYGASTTAEGTAAKTDTTAVTGCVICKGAKIELAMTNANTATAPTLNIQSTGAKNVYFGNGTARPTKTDGTSWLATNTCTFTFDGQYWRTAGKTYIDANSIVTGYLSADRIEAGSLSANKISATSGTFDTANIPNLDATKITSGTIDAARINASALTINSQTLGVSIGRLNNIVTAGDDEDDVVFTEDALSAMGRNVHISAGNVDISTDESTGNVTSLTDTLGTLATTEQVDDLDNTVTNLADNVSNVQDYVNPLTSWINITEVPTSGGGTEPALQMGTTNDNAPVMQLTNSMLQFRMLGDANPLLKMGVVDGESLLEIMKAVVLKELRFNNFAFIARPNGNVCLKYIGRD